MMLVAVWIFSLGIFFMATEGSQLMPMLLVKVVVKADNSEAEKCSGSEIEI